MNGASTAPLRISFAKIKEPLEVPNLLALQTESFDWLLGNDAWKARVEEALESGQDVPTKSGLEEIFEEISPIEDFSGSMSLTFRDHRFEPPKNSIDECKERDFTYAAPLFVTAEFARSTFKYGERGYRFVLLEAGHLAQNVNLAAAGLGLGCLDVGGYYDRQVDEWLGLDGVTHSTVYLLALGAEC